MGDDPAIFLLGAGQEAGDVHEGQDRDVEAVAEPHEPRSLAGRIDIEATRQHHRLVRHDADGLAFDPAEADNDVRGIERLQLEEIALVQHLLDQLVHIVGRVGIGGHQRIERHLDPLGIVIDRADRRLLAV